MKTTGLVSLFVAIAHAVPDVPTSVMVCRGEFPARRSVCTDQKSNTRDIVPMQRMTCSKAVSPSDWSAVLSGSLMSEIATSALNFQSEASVAASLGYITLSDNKVFVSYGDCNANSNLPDLAADKRYVAVIVLDNVAAKESMALNKETRDFDTTNRDPVTRVEMISNVYYYETSLLANSDFRSTLASAYKNCAASTSYCTLPFNSLSPAYTASLILDAY